MDDTYLLNLFRDITKEILTVSLDQHWKIMPTSCPMLPIFVYCRIMSLKLMCCSFLCDAHDRRTRNSYEKVAPKHLRGKLAWNRAESTIYLMGKTRDRKISLLVGMIDTRTSWSAWLSGRTTVSGRRFFAVLRSTCSWWVTTYVGKPSAIGEPTRPTQPFILSRSINE